MALTLYKFLIEDENEKQIFVEGIYNFIKKMAQYL